MPAAPLRFCSASRCSNRVKSGRCPAHAAEQKVEHARFYRGGGFYGRKWGKARDEFLATEGNQFCVCGCGQLANVVDHRIPHRGNRELFWDESNWQAMKKECHDAKTARETMAAPRG